MLVCAVGESAQWGTVPAGAVAATPVTPLAEQPREEEAVFSPVSFTLSIPIVFTIPLGGDGGELPPRWCDTLAAQAKEQADIAVADGASVLCSESGVLVRLDDISRELQCDEISQRRDGGGAAADGGGRGGGGGGDRGKSGGGSGKQEKGDSVQLEIVMQQCTPKGDRTPPKIAVIPMAGRQMTCRLRAEVSARPLANESAAVLLRGITRAAYVEPC